MRNWIIRETEFHPEHVRKYESIMCQGNGYMGVRAAVEENYDRNVRYTLIAGTFDKMISKDTTELPNAADTTALHLTVNGVPLYLSEENTKEYERKLNLYTGVLSRNFIWSPENGVDLKFNFERFVSLKERHVIGQKITITALADEATLDFRSGIQGGERYGDSHFADMQAYVEDGIMLYAETTHESGITFVTGSVVCASIIDKEGSETDVVLNAIAEDSQVHAYGKVGLKKGQTLVIEKLSRIITTRDNDIEEVDVNLLEYQKSEMQNLRKRGYKKILRASQDCWKKLWRDRDVIITGDAKRDQLAVRFAIYHLTIMAPLHDNRMNIGAKGLSGKGYWGHTFWDTEIYMLPYFVWEDPKGARSLLEYRYNCLDAARKNALDSGYDGAKYPWEAAWITDGDTCPEKHFTQYEIHVTADVAYGVYYYYEITHDIDFMIKYGCEILFETAQFWKSRLEYCKEEDVYKINNVIGPDEFTHEADNNAFTNYLAHLNIKLAIEWKERLQREYPDDYQNLNKKLHLEEKVEMWKECADKLILPKANENHILPQDDTYLNLPEIDLSVYRRGEKKLRKDYPYPSYTRLKVSKQADVMNLFLLLEELFTEEEKIASLAYYEPYCVHESSLSLCAYSMLAADCGQQEKAYELFEGAREIDLGNNVKSSDEGIHAASLGGIWQCCVLGFAGVRMCNGVLRVAPNLPKNWTSVVFRIWWHGSHLEVSVSREEIQVTVLSGPKVKDIKLKV